MRKRPFLLAAATVAAGLAVLRTVDAQTPPAGTPPATKVTPAGGPLPATTVRPYSEWTPTAGTAGGAGAVRPAGGYLPPPAGYTGQPPAAAAGGTRPRLTNPVVAGPEGVRPAAAFTPPPPDLELPSMKPATPAAAGVIPVTPPAAVLPPPSVSQDPMGGDSKFTPTPPPSVGVEPPGTLPAPPVGGGKIEVPPLVPPVPATPETGNLGVPPIAAPAPFPPLPPATGGPPTALPGTGTVPPPPAFPAVPGITGGEAPRPAPLATGGLPNKITQTVTLEAACPESVVFGGEFRYELIVKNTGTAAVTGVRVEDELPAGAKYVGSDPPAELNADRLSWTVGTLDAGAEKRIAVRVKPSDEGEIRSRASVTYAAAIEARTKVTRPRVAVTVLGPEVSKAGEEPVFNIKVTNSGTGPAQRMVLQAFLSEGLSHPQGAKLEMEMANLAPGESKTVPLKVASAKAGLQWCQVTVGAQGSQDTTAKASVNVVEPMLQVAQTGPAKCLVRAEPSYDITLSNPGTAATDPITLYAVLPEGFEFLQASEGAAYSAANRAVVWKVAGLPAGGNKAFTLKVRATVAGDGMLRTIAHAAVEQPAPGVMGAGGAPVMRTAARVLEAKTETAIRAEGVAAVRFEVLDLDDPVEVGKEAVYEIRVTNQGTGACSNVQLVAALAEGTAYTGSSGPTQVKAQGQHLVFEPIATLAVKGEAVYRVKIRGTAAGDMRFRVQLTCDQVRTPVVKEESTRFVKE